MYRSTIWTCQRAVVHFQQPHKSVTPVKAECVPVTGTSIMYLSSFLKVKICKTTLLNWSCSIARELSGFLLQYLCPNLLLRFTNLLLLLKCRCLQISSCPDDHLLFILLTQVVSCKCYAPVKLFSPKIQVVYNKWVKFIDVL